MPTPPAPSTFNPKAAADSIPPKPRSVEAIFKPPGVHWVGDGFRVHGYFSLIPNAARRLDPFLMLDYHPEYVYPPTDRPRGVGVHPHRGFETVTLAFKGSVAHHDSAGGGGVIGPGGVQWMTAASGVLHKEYHEREFARRGGPFHMAQLWVNLPRAVKMGPPRYQPISADLIPRVQLPDDAGLVRVVSGRFAGTPGAAKTFSPVTILHALLSPGGHVTFPFPASETAAVVVMRGTVRLAGGAHAVAGDFILYRNEGDLIEVRAESDTELLVLNGQPLGEPIAQYGPFVMNTERELLQAVEDLNAGRFGTLAD